jgi:hypothetical protein
VDAGEKAMVGLDYEIFSRYEMNLFFVGRVKFTATVSAESGNAVVVSRHHKGCVIGFGQNVWGLC